MNNIFKATLLLLCAVAWARAAALPASTPCPLDRNVTPNSLVQDRQMEDTFLSILNDTRHLRDRAQIYFKNTMSFTLCMGGIGLSPLLDGFKAVFKLDDIFRISILSHSHSFTASYNLTAHTTNSLPLPLILLQSPYPTADAALT